MTTTTPNRMMQMPALQDRTAEDLMTTSPQSLRRDATISEATAFLSTRKFSAAPVIDEAGRPVGVVSRTDLLNHHCQNPATTGQNSEGYDPDGEIPVRSVMTPATFCVRADTPAAKVISKMMALNVRRLFVVDDDGVLVGVVSAFDVLRELDRLFRAAE